MSHEQRIELIKKSAMEILRTNTLNDDIQEIPDIFGIDEEDKYYHMVLDYPGTRYKQEINLKSDNEFVRYIVRETIYERNLGRLNNGSKSKQI